MTDWIVDFVRETGAWGVGLLMLLENVFPPIPSELIMPLAGYLSERGELGFAAALVAGAAGSFTGAVGWYWLGRRVSEERFRAWVGRRGRWLAIAPGDVDRVTAWFRRHGAVSVLVGRLVPGVRTLVSLPAGFSRMALPRFLAYTAVGTLAWTAALAWLGRVLGRRFPEVGDYLGPISWAVLGAALVWYVVHVFRMRGNFAGRSTSTRSRRGP